MFDERQTKQLQEKFDPSLVKSRRQGGTNLSYMEGYAVIEAANRIFGFGNWSGTVVELNAADMGEFTKKGENGQPDKNGWKAAYICRYKVTVWTLDHSRSVSFDDVGYGSGTSYISLGDAIESATKESATDAMKRAFRNFGNQFGLALYDKDRKNVGGAFDADEARDKIVNLPSVTVEDCRLAMKYDSRESLGELYLAVKARANGKPAEATA
jgi:DNA repair and recombination protein RAD52